MKQMSLEQELDRLNNLACKHQKNIAKCEDGCTKHTHEDSCAHKDADESPDIMKGISSGQNNVKFNTRES